MFLSLKEGVFESKYMLHYSCVHLTPSLGSSLCRAQPAKLYMAILVFRMVHLVLPQTKVELLFSYGFSALTAEIETFKRLIPYMKSVVHLRCHHPLPTQRLNQKRNGLGEAWHPIPCRSFWKAWPYLELSPLSFPSLGLCPGYKLLRTETLSDILKAYCHFCPIL